MKEILSFTLEPTTIKQLDRVAQALGYSRSQLIEKCVLRILALPNFKKAISQIEAIKAADLLKELEAS